MKSDKLLEGKGSYIYLTSNIQSKNKLQQTQNNFIQ